MGWPSHRLTDVLFFKDTQTHLTNPAHLVKATVRDENVLQSVPVEIDNEQIGNPGNTVRRSPDMTLGAGVQSQGFFRRGQRDVPSRQGGRARWSLRRIFEGKIYRQSGDQDGHSEFQARA